MKKKRYDEIIEQIRDCVQYYEKNGIENLIIRYDLPSKNTSIAYSVLPAHLPHLLGINMQYLKNNKLLFSTKAYQRIQEFLEKSDSIYDSLKGKTDCIFSGVIKTKLEIFKANIDLDLGNVLFISERTYEKAWLSGETLGKINYDYIIVRYAEGAYIAQFIIYSEAFHYYVPVSNVLFNDMMDLKKYLTDQNIYIPVHCSVVSKNQKDKKNIYFSQQDFLERLHFMQQYKEKMNFSICVDQECSEFLLENQYHPESVSLLLQDLSSKETIFTFEELSHKLQDDRVVNEFYSLIQKMEGDNNQYLKLWLELEKEKRIRRRLEEDLKISKETERKLQRQRLKNKK